MIKRKRSSLPSLLKKQSRARCKVGKPLPRIKTKNMNKIKEELNRKLDDINQDDTVYCDFDDEAIQKRGSCKRRDIQAYQFTNSVAYFNVLRQDNNTNKNYQKLSFNIKLLQQRMKGTRFTSRADSLPHQKEARKGHYRKLRSSVCVEERGLSRMVPSLASTGKALRQTLIFEEHFPSKKLYTS
ncbi:unnamed protein product [Moneuplotes crassus]|uniref:Uncharacterized protein n=1 Tax=Euplotes crassus TaxID=5936 RepID=A0AAD1XRM9_EUPCR|nr:unnamed protein product [Moneuplotes crassus]